MMQEKNWGDLALSYKELFTELNEVDEALSIIHKMTDSYTKIEVRLFLDVLMIKKISRWPFSIVHRLWCIDYGPQYMVHCLWFRISGPQTLVHNPMTMLHYGRYRYPNNEVSQNGREIMVLSLTNQDHDFIIWYRVSYVLHLHFISHRSVT